MNNLYKSPWLILVVLGLAFGAGYITGDDNRIEKADAFAKAQAGGRRG